MVNGRPGVAPQTAKREEFTRLIAEGLSIAETARRVGIHYRTGRRWLRGRTVSLPPVIARDGWWGWSPSTSAPTSPTGVHQGTGRATVRRGSRT